MQARIQNCSGAPVFGVSSMFTAHSLPENYAGKFVTKERDYDAVCGSYFAPDIHAPGMSTGLNRVVVKGLNLNAQQLIIGKFEPETALKAGPLGMSAEHLDIEIHYNGRTAKVTNFMSFSDSACILLHGRATWHKLHIGVWLEKLAGNAHWKLRLTVNNSGFGEASLALDGISISIPQMADRKALYPWNPWSSIRGGYRPFVADGRWYLPLTGATRLNDGASFAWGIDIFTAASRQDVLNIAALKFAPTLGCGTAEAWEGHWGVHGAVPEMHPSIDPVKAIIAYWHDFYAELNSRTLRGGTSLWDEPILNAAQAAYTNTTGEQGFGITRGTLALHASPAWLHLVETSILWDSFQRPMHYRRNNGIRVTEKTDPDVVFFDSMPHILAKVSPNRLGVPYREMQRTSLGNEMKGRDVEHGTIELASVYHRLTGDPMIQDSLIDEGQCYLFQRKPYEDPWKKYAAAMPDMTRTLRQEKIAVNVVLAGTPENPMTPDPVLLERLIKRVDCYHATFAMMARGDEICPSIIMDADDRMLAEPFWSCWEISIAEGMAATHNLLTRINGTSGKWLPFMVQQLKQWIIYAWQWDATLGRHRMMKGIDYMNGKPVPMNLCHDRDIDDDGDDDVHMDDQYEGWARALVNIACDLDEPGWGTKAQQIKEQLESDYQRLPPGRRFGGDKIYRDIPGEMRATKLLTARA